jgi:hypothetical protein
MDAQLKAGLIAATLALLLIARDAGAFRNLPRRIWARVRRRAAGTVTGDA